MKTFEKIEDRKIHDVIIDPSLDQFNNVVRFPEKVEEAKKTIAKIGIPNVKK